MYFVLTAWCHMKQSTIINFFKKCGYSGLLVPSNNEGQVDVTEDNWNSSEFASDINFDLFIAFDDDVAACGFETIKCLYNLRLKKRITEIEDSVEEGALPVVLF